MSAADASATTFPFLPPRNIRRVGVICHRHADPDAYMSAYAISKLLNRIAPAAKVDVVLPDGMSLLTRRLSETFKQDSLVEGEGGADDYDLLVAVDMGHTELLKDWSGKLRSSPGVKVLVDHHPLQEGSPYDHMVVDTSASSASEVVATIYRDLDVKMDRSTAQALLLGIMFDSQHLLIAKERTLREVVRLLDSGASIDDARLLLRSPPDYGEVIAKLKAAKRVKLYRVAGWVIVTTTVGSFQSNVARSLVSMGADAAIVSGETGGETRGSLRSNQRFWEATKVHLGTDVATPMAKDGGIGGGHPTAASFTCTLPEDKAAEAALALFASLLKDKPAEIR
ncbi:MAG TPA: DHH family phosphoesterase [Nitrososphaerales archaeon]|nr:DHH family phosphoesterase [Nitrososphaerales archaeon]HUK75701.1 DHH family phosphoesterase [Nitrososphaerales archaeon]